GSVTLEERVLRLRVEPCRRLIEHEQKRVVAHETARQGQFLPLAETHFDALGPGRTELRFEPGRQPLDDVLSARALDRGRHGGFIVQPWQIANVRRLSSRLHAGYLQAALIRIPGLVSRLLTRLAFLGLFD